MRNPEYIPIKKKIPFLSEKNSGKGIVHNIHFNHLHTVCEESRCPNQRECSANGVATFLIGGDICTRNCRFCNIRTGRPLFRESQREREEIIRSVLLLGLRHVVITSVTRDDDEIFLAEHLARIIQDLRGLGKSVEVLIPDFHGRPDYLDVILEAHPHVLAHNVETVERLSPVIRPQADFQRSLDVLGYFREKAAEKILLKSGFLLGLGETPEEIRKTIRILKKNGVDILTIGQYFQPDTMNVPVAKYYQTPELDEIRAFAQSLDFSGVEVSVYTRSSYMAENTLRKISTP